MAAEIRDVSLQAAEEESNFLEALLDANAVSLRRICNRYQHQHQHQHTRSATCMLDLQNSGAITMIRGSWTVNEGIVSSLSHSLKEKIKEKLKEKIDHLEAKITSVDNTGLRDNLGRFLGELRVKSETQELGGSEGYRTARLTGKMLDSVSQNLSDVSQNLSDRDSWKDFFDANHNRFKGTKNDYSFNPDSMANAFCIGLAKELTPLGKSFIKTLLPKET